MQHFILRCKHCQKEYTYCTYGNGPIYGTEEGCSMDYCAECQKAIDKALSQITVKFVAKPVEISEPRLLDVFKKIKDEYQTTNKNSFTFTQVVLFNLNEYDIVETYIHNNKKYQIKWNEDTPDEKHIFLFMEYDVVNEQFTNKVWKFDEKDSYNYSSNSAKILQKHLDQHKNTESTMPLPTGILLYNGFDWDIDSFNVPKREPEHILRTVTVDATGEEIKRMVKNRVYMADLTEIAKLVDKVDYRFVYEKYDDENMKVITKVECV